MKRKALPDHEPLEQFAHLKVMDGLPDGEPADPRALVLLDDDEVLAFELEQRLADRIAADPELGGETQLRETLRRPEDTLDDPLPQLLMDLIRLVSQCLPSRRRRWRLFLFPRPETP